jgi:catalase
MSGTDLTLLGVYVQLHFKSKQGTAFITQEDSANYSPDYSTKDLFQAIEKGDFPAWDVMVQTMDAKTAEDVWEKQGINVFDLTHVWPQSQFPLRKVGEFTLNENVQNYFAEIEQIAFNPAHLVPGIDPTADPVLQYDHSYIITSRSVLTLLQEPSFQLPRHAPPPHRRKLPTAPRQPTARSLQNGKLPARRTDGLLQPRRTSQLSFIH